MTLIYRSEQWKEAPGFPDYSVSNFGRIKRVTLGGNNFCKVGRILKCSLEDNGYPRVGLYLNKKVIRVLVHRLVAIAFIGPPPTEKHEVAHYDNDRANSCVNNLRWATRKENHADKKIHGTSQCGSRNGNSKLTLDQVEDIKTSNDKLRVIAERHGVHKGTVWMIRSGRSWSHLNK